MPCPEWVVACSVEEQLTGNFWCIIAAMWHGFLLRGIIATVTKALGYGLRPRTFTAADRRHGGEDDCTAPGPKGRRTCPGEGPPDEPRRGADYIKEPLH